jgi:SulP family sulfate permease
MSKSFALKRYLPILVWLPRYDRSRFTDDSIAAIIVAIMIIPQSLAYAMVAGLPPQAGLYAAMMGLSVYALFGTSNTLSVGPVAVLSLMTAAALGKLSLGNTETYLLAAAVLALLSGVMLLVLGLLRLGFMANFISHPVVSAFITASAIIIACSQLRYLLGVEASGENLIELLHAVVMALPQTNIVTLLLGLAAIALILFCTIPLKAFLLKRQVNERLATSLSRSGPVVAALGMALIVWLFRLDESGVELLGAVPAGLPDMTVPGISFELLRSLWGSALLIAIIGFVESVSVAQVMAARRRERLNLDQELVGLGAANMASSFAGGFPVTGGFSRSVVNFQAGAATPLAGAFTALLIAIVALFFTPALYWLPRVSLAAIIIVAVFPLIDFSMLWRSWRYSKSDFIAVCMTLGMTLLIGVEIGIAAGVLASVFIHLYKTSQPHVAVVGRVPGTEHFRNVQRHQVETFESLLSIRVDESLYFANSRYLEELIFKLVAKKPNLEHVILMCNAVNTIDLSALEALENINSTLNELEIKLHLSEVKGPIMDKLGSTGFFKTLTGNNYLSHNQAVEDLLQERARRPLTPVG